MNERFVGREPEDHKEHLDDLLRALYLDVRPKLEQDEYNEHEILIYAERLLTSIGVANVYANTTEIVTPRAHMGALLSTIGEDKRRLVPVVTSVVASEAAFHPGSMLDTQDKARTLWKLRHEQVSAYARHNEGDPAYFMADFHQRMETMQSRMREHKSIFRSNLLELKQLSHQFDFDYHEDRRMYGLEQERESKLRRELGSVIKMLGAISPYSNRNSDS